MKRFYLIRHAKSSWDFPDLEDFERPLNGRGKKDAPFMGKRLKKEGVKPDLIISSPAVRAIKTAKVIAGEVGYPKKNIQIEDDIYGLDMTAFMSIICGIDDSYNCVLLFGHNPAMNILAEYLTRYRVDNIPTCGVFCMDFDAKSWKQVGEGKGKFVSFDYPKKHKK